MPIHVDNLQYTYMKGTPFEANAVNRVSLKIADGEFVGIIGQTGSGKTTLVQLICGLLKPDGGRIVINEADINGKNADRKKLRQTVGVVFQYPEYQLFEETVEKDIAFGPRKTGVPEAEIGARVKEALKLVEVPYDEVRDKSPFELSGGQKRRVAIAGVLAMRPKVLILDEPVAGLDPVGREHLMRLITTLNENGTTIIMITHSMDDLAVYAKRVIVMHEGALKMDAAPKEVFARADELIGMGLGIPVVSKMVRLLNDRGKNIPADIISVEEFERYLLQRLGGIKP